MFFQGKVISITYMKMMGLALYIKKDTIFRVSNVADVFYDVKFLGKDKNSGTIYLELV